MTICNRTPTSTEEARQFIAERMPYFTGQIEVLPGLPETPPPVKRSDWIDPETRLSRKTAKPKRVMCASEKLEHQRAMRQRGNRLLREEWPELNLDAMAAKAGVHKTTIQYRLGIGATLQQAIKKGMTRL